MAINSVTGNTLLESGYFWTAKQCLGSVLTDGSSNIIAFFQYGDEFWLVTPISNGTASGLTAVSVPNGVKVKVTLNIGVALGDGCA
jgi:hypothetical protein